MPIFEAGLSFPGVDGAGSLLSDSGGGLILSRVDVARAPSHVSTEGLEGLDQDCGLDGHVEGSHDSGSFKGLFWSEFFSA